MLRDNINQLIKKNTENGTKSTSSTRSETDQEGAEGRDRLPSSLHAVSADARV